jgi:hypothetical protein
MEEVEPWLQGQSLGKKLCGQLARNSKIRAGTSRQERTREQKAGGGGGGGTSTLSSLQISAGQRLAAVGQRCQHWLKRLMVVAAPYLQSLVSRA